MKCIPPDWDPFRSLYDLQNTEIHYEYTHPRIIHNPLSRISPTLIQPKKTTIQAHPNLKNNISPITNPLLNPEDRNKKSIHTMNIDNSLTIEGLSQANFRKKVQKSIGYFKFTKNASHEQTDVGHLFLLYCYY